MHNSVTKFKSDRLNGTVLHSPRTPVLHHTHVTKKLYASHQEKANQFLPDYFNWLDKKCVEKYHFNGQDSKIQKFIADTITDQGQCGGCYIVAGTDMLADRYAIWTGKNVQKFSPAQVLALMAKFPPQFSKYCCGGDVHDVFDIIGKFGTVLEHEFMPWLELVQFYSPGGQCVSPQVSVKYGNFKNHTSFQIQNPNNLNDRAAIIQAIKKEIFLNGPIVTCCNIFVDFENGYQGNRPSTLWSDTNNIYIQQSDKHAGGHAMVIVGWGIDRVPGFAQPVPYWIIRNSWSGWNTDPFLLSPSDSEFSCSNPGGFCKVAMALPNQSGGKSIIPNQFMNVDVSDMNQQGGMRACIPLIMENGQIQTTPHFVQTNLPTPSENPPTPIPSENSPTPTPSENPTLPNSSKNISPTILPPNSSKNVSPTPEQFDPSQYVDQNYFTWYVLGLIFLIFLIFVVFLIYTKK